MNIQSTPQIRSNPEGLVHELIELSHRFGSDPEFARGGGGNSSVKADGILYIKPSGTSLASLTPETLIPLDMKPLLELLNAPSERPVAGGTDEVFEVAVAARIGGARRSAPAGKHPEPKGRRSAEGDQRGTHAGRSGGLQSV